MLLGLQPLKAKEKSDIKLRNLKKTFLKLFAITIITLIVIKKAIISKIVLSQKISCILGDLHVNDC